MDKGTRAIWKYKMPLEGKFSLDIPDGYLILDVQPQFDTPCMWAMVNPDAKKQKQDFVIIGTGNHFHMDFVGAHVGTFQMHGGALIWHVFHAGCPTDEQEKPQ